MRVFSFSPGRAGEHNRNTIPVSPLPLNCPKCPRRMAYITSPADGIYLYRCAHHGEWQLGPGGLDRAPREDTPPTQSEITL